MIVRCVFGVQSPWKNIATLTGHTDDVNQAVWSPDGKLLATASADHVIHLWDTHTGSQLRILEGHARSVIDVTFSPDGRSLASASLDGTIILWDVNSGQPSQTIKGPRQSYLGCGL